HRSRADRAGAARAGAAVSQPPWLRAAHIMPRLRLPLAVPELRRLARRPPLPQAARVPSLRLCDTATGFLSEVPRDRELRARRSRRRTAGAGGGGVVRGRAR